MELSPDGERFIKLSSIVLDIVPMHLRKLFIKKWDEKGSNQNWTSDTSSGTELFNKLSQKLQENKKERIYTDKLREGNEKEWDMTVLGKVFLEYGLKLIDGPRGLTDRCSPFNDGEKVFILRDIRNQYFAHLPSMSCLPDVFKRIIDEIKIAGDGLFETTFESEIDEIEHSSIKEEKLKDIERLVTNAIANIGEDLKKVLSTLEKIRSETRIGFSNIQKEIATGSIKQLGDLQRTYKKMYENHKIHTVENGNIRLKAVPIEEFAVTLKISDVSCSKDESRNEARYHLRNLAIVEDESDIELGNLINEDKKSVIFIRGIAGMGKSVLAKQLAYKWACGKLYNNFKPCIVFECRDLNVYKARQGTVPKQQIFAGFLRSICQFDLRDEEQVLFVVDGLDELDDFDNDDSIICQLLDPKYNSKYCSSTIIITGRPHVESKLEKLTLCGLKVFEIQGLGNRHIDNYIEKFSSSNENLRTKVMKAKSLTKPHLPILHVPQFLNTFCCIASLTDGEAILTETELYCWTLYLMLSQHGDRSARDSRSYERVFEQYSNLLLKLSKTCYSLLEENKIFIEENINLWFQDNEETRVFMKSLFVDMSCYGQEKFQFKHLSLMEFLSAIHVCTMMNRNEIIEKGLKNNLFQVVSFVCGLIGGASCSSITECLLKAVLRSEDCPQLLLKDVMKSVDHCRISNKVKFEISVEFIVSFLNSKFTEEDVLEEILLGLNCFGFDSSAKVSNDVLEICRYLVEEVKWSEDKVQEIFQRLDFRWFHVNKTASVKYIRYFEHVSAIKFQYIDVDCNEFEKEIKDALMKCKRVHFEDCGFTDKDKSGSNRLFDCNLLRLVIKKCQFRRSSFEYIFTFGMSSWYFELSRVKIEEIMLEDVVKAIKYWWKNESLRLRVLAMKECNANITQEIQREIRQCGIRLKINRYELEPLQSQDHPQLIDTQPTYEDVSSVPGNTGELKFFIGKNQGFCHYSDLYSIDIPDNAVDSRINLTIRITTASSIQMNHCSFGEVIVSDIVEIEKTGVTFKNPATLTIKHSLFELPDHSSIVIKAYKCSDDTWIALTADPSIQKHTSVTVTTKIFETAHFAAFFCLKSDKHIVSPKQSSFSPFGNESVKFEFNEGTFEDADAMLECKMKVFLPEEIRVSNSFGLTPLLILYMREDSNKPAAKSIRVKLRLSKQPVQDEKLLAFYEDCERNRSLVEIKADFIGKEVVELKLDRFYVPSRLIVIYTTEIKLASPNFYELLERLEKPLYHASVTVYFAICDKNKLCVGCCDNNQTSQSDKRMEEKVYTKIADSVVLLYNNTTLSFKLLGCYTIVNDAVNLEYVSSKCNFTTQFEIQPESTSNKECILIVSNEGDDQALVTLNLHIPEQSHSGDREVEDDITDEEDLHSPDEESTKKPPSPSTSPSAVDLPPLTESPSSSKESEHHRRVLPPSTMSTSLRMTSPKTAVDDTADHSTPHHSPSSGTPSYDVRTPSQYPGIAKLPSSPTYTDQDNVLALLNDRELMMKIADLLEKNSGLPLQELALRFGINGLAHLTSVEPSRRFFTHLAHSRGDVRLIDLKRLIEQDLRFNHRSIFPSIERAITERRVAFTMESTLAELKANGVDWFFLLKYVADKLMENTFQLPSWKDVANYFGYEHTTIESFCANLPVERPTIKLFRHLSFLEDVPTIATLKDHLQALNRFDIIRLIDG